MPVFQATLRPISSIEKQAPCRVPVQLCGNYTSFGSSPVNIGLVEDPSTKRKHVIFFDDVGMLVKVRPSGAFETYSDAWVESVSRLPDPVQQHSEAAQ